MTSAKSGGRLQAPEDLQSIVQLFRAYPHRCIMVRDLPFCCDEARLIALCKEQTSIEPIYTHVQVDERRRTLHFAYLMFASQTDAQLAIRRLHNLRFLGRDLRVSPYEANPTPEPGRTGALHIYFRTAPKPATTDGATANDGSATITEQTLRSVLESYGELEHVVIRQHQRLKSGRQEGFGFATFRDPDVHATVVSSLKHRSIGGVVYDCTLSKQPHNARRGPTAAQTASWSDEGSSQTSGQSDTGRTPSPLAPALVVPPQVPQSIAYGAAPPALAQQMQQPPPPPQVPVFVSYCPPMYAPPPPLLYEPQYCAAAPPTDGLRPAAMPPLVPAQHVAGFWVPQYGAYALTSPYGAHVEFCLPPMAAAVAKAQPDPAAHPQRPHPTPAGWPRF